ncbi:protein of unknown function [Alcaligenes faecalis subsp. faecalis]|nr:protein of unknown function [Alcaligenes faecalis subsp. faecalis]
MQNAARLQAVPVPGLPTDAWTARAPDRHDQAHSVRFAGTGATWRQTPLECAQSRCSGSSWPIRSKRGHQVYIGRKCCQGATVQPLSTHTDHSMMIYLLKVLLYIQHTLKIHWDYFLDLRHDTCFSSQPQANAALCRQRRWHPHRGQGRQIVYRRQWGCGRVLPGP